MKAYIQVKQLGKRKCSIEKMPVDFPVAPASVQELIEAVVSWQVSEYNERQAGCRSRSHHQCSAIL